jgi:hypothetical protein
MTCTPERNVGKEDFQKFEFQKAVTKSCGQKLEFNDDWRGIF